ncbi:hypothetical protein [Amycolatopsis sp.]|uniref:hypothetical protein n=1 Tax=Amycolatopsis sp. TaxID=37632 RepID=UPI002D0245A4|nr:hypothetical protein [Amycolatopsis sp.]HVV12446.1 hypothetical protein [Amycolatopsis sp.]
MPEYTAEDSLRPASRSYYTRSHYGYGAAGPRIVAAQRKVETKTQFVCSGAHCACSGYSDCWDCFVDGWCTGPCTCDGAGGTCIC